jgi:hypothetical protein
MGSRRRATPYRPDAPARAADAEDADHLISPEERLRVAMARQ